MCVQYFEHSNSAESGTGLVARWHVGSSQTGARTCVPCIGRQILNRCATREAPTTSILAPVFVRLFCGYV